MKIKKKWPSAEAKYRAAQLEESWAQIKKKHGAVEEERKIKRALSAAPYTPPLPAARESNTKHIPSLTTAGGSGSRPEDKIYTGTEMIGISIIHKSCLQPIFSTEAAKDAANMRR